MNSKIRILMAFTLCVCLLVLLGSVAAAHPAETTMAAASEARALQGSGTVVYYVRPGGTGDCTTWASACDLQTALAAAASGSEIWVAAGVYKPAADPAATDPRTATFQLKTSVAIYGGFAGTETSRDGRSPAANVTILSGDIDSNDSQTPIITDLSTVTGNGTNSYHVVTGADGAILDGVTITAGNANGTVYTGQQGGGMYNPSSSSPTLTSVSFSGNSAVSYGGGMYNRSSSPALTNVTFSGNSAPNGGAMHNRFNSNPTLTNVTFSANSSVAGGGMFNVDHSSPALTNVTFNGNVATSNSGGAMYNSSSSPTLTDVTFGGNSARFGGGGIYNDSSSPTLTNVIFRGNSADQGGAMYNTNSNPPLTNVTFNGNSATNSGGGMWNYSSSPTLTNVTFSGNSAPSGGGINNTSYRTFSSAPVIRNTILWGDTGGEVVNADSTSAPTITSSVVQGGCPAGTTCTDVTSADPHLGVLGDYGGTTQTIPLLPGSSAIDAGLDALPDGTAVCPATDQRGVTCPQGAHCDIGAFEYNYTGIYYVMPGGLGTQDGQSWANASDLQSVLRTSRSGDEIWAAAGTYKPAADPTDRTATFQLKTGVAIYGGFAGTETSRDGRDPAANVTILSGDLNGDDGADFANNGENSYHVVTGADGTILDGVTITAGNANGDSESDQTGGGMYNAGSSPALNNVTFSGSSAATYGGGMFNLNNSNPTLTGGMFSGNVATDSGGGMYNQSSNPALTNVIFSSNVATASDGGGMYNFSSSPPLNNVIFSGNSAGRNGGGMYNCYNSSPALTGGSFGGNSAPEGGGIYNDSSSPTLTNVTFSDNSAGNGGGGMFNWNNSSPTLNNVTFSRNSAGLRGSGGGMFNSSSSPTLTNVTFSDNSAGTHGSGGGMANFSSSPALNAVTFKGNSSGYSGGGMLNDSSSSPTLTNVTFSGNSADQGGGMDNADRSSPTLTNVTFSSNSAGIGGGMFNHGGSSPALTNVTFSGNSAPNGGGIINDPSSSPVIRNAILWGDTGGEVVNVDPTSPPTIDSSVVQGGCPAGATCTNLITADPHLGALGDYGGATQTIPLLPGSSAIDAGLDALPDGTAVCPTTDQRGVTRPQGAHCDVGAFEYNYTGIYYVTPGGRGTRDGQSWANASDLQGALRTSRSGDEIWAAAGAYKPAADPAAVDPRTATFQLKSGVAIYGGFAGNEASRDGRNPAANVTILSGDIDGNDSQTPIITDLSTVTGNGTNCYHVVTGANGATLDGVTITAGNANGPMFSDRNGGGLYNHGASSPTLTNVTFSGNSAYDGGGMYNDFRSPTLTNVTFSGNSASHHGGGMYNDLGSRPTLTNVTFSGNSAHYDGGGMYNEASSSPTLNNVTFSGNFAGFEGGGMSNHASSPALTGVTFSGNSAGNRGGGMFDINNRPTLTNVTFNGNSAGSGGGMYNRTNSPTLTNVTFSGNVATVDEGGGMYNGSSSPVIRNAILWGDTGGEVVNADPTSPPTIDSSAVQGGCPAGATCTNLVVADPRLGALGAYGGATQTIPLLPGSSAIDAGLDALPDGTAVCPTTDQRGVARPQGAHCDIGAFESQGFAFGNLSGTPQSALVNTAFAEALGLTVTANNPAEPVDGGQVTFSAGASPEGASATVAGSPVGIAGGLASVSAAANGTAGSYTVTASAQGAADAAFALTNTLPQPTLDAISPASAVAGSGELTLTVSGSGFVAGSVVRWKGADLATTYVNPTQLSAVVPAGSLAVVQTAQVTVFTPAPGGGTSDVLAFFVTQAAAGVSGQDVSDGDDPAATFGPASASATGSGLLAVAQYDANPGGTPSFMASGTYFDVYAAPDSTFTQVTIVACSLNADDKLFWWDTGQAKWQKASPQSYDAASGCVTLVVDANSSPSLGRLQGTFFAAGVVPNRAPVALAGGPYLGAINTAIAFDGSASSDADGDPLTYAWDFGDGATGTDVNPTYSYGTAGIYRVCLTVNDASLASAPACTFAVVYDPSGGFVTGGGWIASPAGAYVADPALAGKATFGFVSRYQKGATVPTGNTEFQIKVANLNFKSTAYEWLVVAGAHAKYKGVGTINGAGNYGFMLTATDGQIKGGGGVDTFRIKIWDKNNGDAVVYDNQKGEADDSHAGTALGGGSIVIHTK